MLQRQYQAARDSPNHFPGDTIHGTGSEATRRDVSAYASRQEMTSRLNGVSRERKNDTRQYH
jgi:hypothetical protein